MDTFNSTAISGTYCRPSFILKNSTVSNSSFCPQNASDAALIKIKSSVVQNSVLGYFCQPVFLLNSTFLDFTVNTYNHSFSDSFIIKNSRFQNGSATAFQNREFFLKIDTSVFINYSFSGNYIFPVINNSVFKSSPFNNLSLGNYKAAFSSFLGSGICRGGTGIGPGTNNSYGYSGLATPLLSNITIVGHDTGFYLPEFIKTGFGIIHSNIFNNNSFNLFNKSVSNINATFNFWGVVDSVSIKNKIYDFYKNPNSGKVFISNFLNSPDSNAPISPPLLLTKTKVSGGVKLTWSQNPESDLKGYKIYYGTFDGFSFSNSVFSGKVLSDTISGASISDYFGLTAVDRLSDGINDLAEGHESWYADDIPDTAKISASQLSICSGDTAVLTANNQYRVFYRWFKDGVSIGSNSNKLAVTKAGVYKVVEYHGNCTDSSNSVTISILSALVPGIPQPIIGSAKVCVPASNVTYTITSVPNATSYQWTLPSGQVLFTSNPSIKINFDVNSTNGQLSVRGINSCRTGLSVSKNISFFKNPGKPQRPTGPDSFCQMTASTNYKTLRVKNDSSYFWRIIPSTAAGSSSDDTFTTLLWNSTFSGYASVSVMSYNSNCFGDFSDSLLVFVKALPLKPDGLTGAPVVCEGEQNVAFDIPALGNIDGYIWTLPWGKTDTNNSTGILVDFDSNSVSGFVTVKGYNQCGAGPADDQYVLIYPVPAKPQKPTGSLWVCANGPINTYSVKGVLNATGFNWKLSPAAAGSISGSGITANVKWDTAYSGKAQIQAQSKNSVCAGNWSDILEVDVYKQPQAPLVISPVIYCQFEIAVPLTATGNNLLWFTSPTGGTGSPTAPVPDTKLSGIFHFFVAADNISCQSNRSEIIVQVKIKPPPPVISFLHSMLLSDAINGNQWYYQNGKIIGAVNQYLLPSQNGRYFSIVTLDGCSSDTSNRIDVILSAIKEELSKGLLIYPNPARQVLHIDFCKSELKPVEFSLCNSFGQLMIKRSLSPETNCHYIIDLHEFPTGIYLLKLDKPDSVFYAKIVIE